MSKKLLISVSRVRARVERDVRVLNKRIDQLLATFQDSKAVWIYRNQDDVIRSTLKKWLVRNDFFLNTSWTSSPKGFSDEI